MHRLLEHYQLQLAGCKPMWFDSIYVSMLSWSYKTGRNNIIRSTWVGLLSNIHTLFNRQRCSSLIYIAKK